jgi:hypothetical protein
MSVLGALRQYGLLDDTGPKMVRLSPIALAIQLAQPGSPERARAIQDAASRPKVFAELMEQYKDGYPSADAMMRNLALNSAYTEEAAARLIAAFRETLDLLEQQGIADASRESVEEEDKDDGDRRTPEQKQKKREGQMPDAGRESMDIPIPIVSGGLAILRVPRRMSDTDYTAFKTVLDAILTGMKGALTAPVDPPPGGGS